MTFNENAVNRDYSGKFADCGVLAQRNTTARESSVEKNHP